MPTPDTLRLTLVRAPDDEASFSPGYQAELRQFYSLARAEGGKISAVTFTTDKPDGGDGFVGEFLVPFASIAGSTLGAAASAWLQGRAGRTLRLKMGDTEVEANCPSELYGLLSLTMAVAERLEKPNDHV
ncbi:hypothetical protein [Caballeronia sordidicola]|uniref:hypothetical protein n=1 Tax=Caballeronia sordidicola TaxID=196367 RepID=UPI00068E1DF6|nr:hypothetical protein [Caballeronia sordidicola]